MTPKVLAWERDFATDEERILAARANAKSGIRALEQHAAEQSAASSPGVPVYRDGAALPS